MATLQDIVNLGGFMDELEAALVENSTQIVDLVVRIEDSYYIIQQVTDKDDSEAWHLEVTEQ